MFPHRCCGVLLAGSILAACHDRGAVSPISSAELSLAAAHADGGLGTTGGGYYDILGLPVQFSFSAVESPDGKASGHFRIFAEAGGLTVDVMGEVVCVAVDPANHRAWVGAIVTRNASTDPDLQTDIHEVGDDVWFRVLDSGEGAGAAADRTSFTGFKGAAGLDTSPQYCAARIWPDDNARTWPVTQGNISVRP